MTKGRNLSSVRLLGTEFYGSAPQSVKYYETSKDVSTMFAGDTGHYGYPNFPPDRDIGGPFTLQGVRTNRGVLEVGDIWRGGALNQHYNGAFAVDVVHTGAWVGSFPPDAWGATAYSRMKPTKPVASIPNILYELKDLPGMLRDLPLSNHSVIEKISKLRSQAGEFVGFEFGWKAFLSDMRTLCNIQRKAQKKLEWLLRHNGKPVNTALELVNTFDVVGNVPITGYNYLQPVLVTQYYRFQPRGQQVTTNRERVWAKAQWRYFLPGGPRDVDWTNQMMAALYGENISASQIYKAIPWTWLIDWFYNLGTMIQNLETGVADRLAAEHFYMMRLKEWTVRNSISGWFVRQDGSNVDIHGSAESIAFVKTRARGDPFGFATDGNTLSGMQLAILAALGLSRIR